MGKCRKPQLGGLIYLGVRPRLRYVCARPPKEICINLCQHWLAQQIPTPTNFESLSPFRNRNATKCRATSPPTLASTPYLAQNPGGPCEQRVGSLQYPIFQISAFVHKLVLDTEFLIMLPSWSCCGHRLAGSMAEIQRHAFSIIKYVFLMIAFHLSVVMLTLTWAGEHHPCQQS